MTHSESSETVLRIPEIPTPTRTRVVMVSSTILVILTLSILEILWYAPWYAWAVPVLLLLMSVLTWPMPDVFVDLKRRRVVRPPVADLGFDEILRVELLPTAIADTLPNRRFTRGPAWAVVLRGLLEGRDGSRPPYRDDEIPESVVTQEPGNTRPLDAVLVTSQHPLGSGFAWAKKLARSFGVPLRIDLGDLDQQFAPHELDEAIATRAARLGNGRVGSKPEAVEEKLGEGGLRLEWPTQLGPQLALWLAAMVGTGIVGALLVGSTLPPLAQALGYVVLLGSLASAWRVACTLLFFNRCELEIGPDQVRTVCGRRWMPVQTLRLDEIELVHGQAPRVGASREVGGPDSHAVVVLGDHRASALWAPREVAQWVPARVHQFLGP